MSFLGKIADSGALGLGLTKTGRNVLLGKEQKAESAKRILSPEERAQRQLGFQTQRSAISRLQGELGRGDAGAATQADAQARAIRAGGADARRRLQSLIAQRGLGKSSIGLSQQTGLARQTAERAGLAERLAPIEARRRRLMELQQLAGLGAQATQGAQGFLQAASAGGRTGGIAPLLGAGVGGILGGPAGASIGLGAGQAATGIF